MLLALAAPASNAAIEDYKILDWIQSTDGGGQYIDTGIVGQSGVYAEMKMMWLKAGGVAYTVVGSRNEKVYCSLSGMSNNTCGKWNIQYNGATPSGSSIQKSVGGVVVNDDPHGTGVVYQVTTRLVSGLQSMVALNENSGTTITASGTTEGDFDTEVTMYAFAQHRYSGGKWWDPQGCSVVRIYSLDIYTNATAESNGVLARQFVAAKRRSDDAVGFYDSRTESFFPNKSATPFYYEEKGARVNVAVSPSLFGTVTPEEGELVAETAEMTYTLSGATLFDDGVTGYWDVNRAWRAEFDKAVYTPLDGTAEEIAETTFTQTVGTGASVVWNFKNVKCHLTASAVGAGTVLFANGKASYWAVSNEVVTLTATPAAGTTFTGWTGDVKGVADTTEPVIEITNTGARKLVANFVRVPSEYRVLEYIESTEGGNQYINSRIEGRTGVEVVADMMCNVHTSVEIFMGCRKGTSGNYRFFPICGTGNNVPYWAQAYGTAGSNGGSLVAGERCTVRSRMTSGTSALTVNGTTTEWTRADEIETGLSMYIFCCNGNGSASTFYKGRLYAMQIYTNATAETDGILARNFVPVRQRAGEEKVGLYDMVSGEFFPNASAIPFAYAESGLPMSVAASPYLFGEVDPILGEFGAETPAVTYTLTDAVTFDDGVVGYWNSNETWRAEFDKAVYTPVNGSAEEVFATNFTRTVGAGATVVWNFKNVKCRVGSEVVGSGRVVIDGREGFKWLEADETVTVKAIPALGARFVEWTGDTKGIADVHSPNITLTIDGARTLTARFVKVPSKYEVLDYIESTKEDANGNLVNGNQYIDTGVLSVTGVVAKASMMWIVKPPASTCFLGSRPLKDASGDQRFMFIGTTQNSNPRFQMSVANGSTPMADEIVLSNRVEVLAREVDNGEGGTAFSLTVGKSTVSGTSATQPTQELARACYIFAQNGGSTSAGTTMYAGARLYSLRMWTGATADSDGTLARDFVPVRVKRGAREGEIGLYDCVSGQFFENKNALAPPFLYGELPPSDYGPGFSVLVR